VPSHDWVDGKGRTFQRLLELKRVKAGMVLEIGRQMHLVGTVNQLGGDCDDCMPFERSAVVKRYRYVRWN
jgi:hypothetical protein